MGHRVHFANVSRCTIVNTFSSDEDDFCTTSISDPSSSAKLTADHPISFLATSHDRFLDNTKRSRDGCAAADIDSHPSHLLIRTKEVDGPGPTTLTTHTLVTMLVKRGTLTLEDIEEYFRTHSQMHFCPAHGPQPEADDHDHSVPASPRPSDSPSNVVDQHLCICVAARLAALRDRIRANGTAVLPPSRAAMGPPFVPALDYLRGLVLDAGGDRAGGSPRRLACEADPSQPKRARPCGRGGEPAAVGGPRPSGSDEAPAAAQSWPAAGRPW
jgi:hypothetical protein